MRISGDRYTIIAIEYLKRWEDATLVIDCTMNIIACFLFENVVT
jgi:hypothetical protein